MDPLAQQAREHHRLAGQCTSCANRHRQQRDELIKQLWATERRAWTYAKLAAAVGCSPELIAKIITGRND